MEKPRRSKTTPNPMSFYGWRQPAFVFGVPSSPSPSPQMSTSISTSTRPTTEIDLQESQRVINKAHQLPLQVLAFKDGFTEATQNIARIAENANPEDPNLLNVEIAAIKVRPSGFWSRY